MAEPRASLFFVTEFHCGLSLCYYVTLVYVNFVTLCYREVKPAAHQEVWLHCQHPVQAEGLDAQQLLQRHTPVAALDHFRKLVDGLQAH